MPTELFIAASQKIKPLLSIKEKQIKKIKKMLDDLFLDEDRLNIFNNYCKSCGSKDLNCTCMRNG